MIHEFLLTTAVNLANYVGCTHRFVGYTQLGKVNLVHDSHRRVFTIESDSIEDGGQFLHELTDWLAEGGCER